MEEETDDDDSEGDKSKERVVRGVLLFCALVVAGVAVYTTYMLFSVYDIDISFSPPVAAEFNLSEEGEGLGTASFVVDQEKENEEGKIEIFKSQPIRPYGGGGIFRSPLIISEDVDGGEKLVFVVIALEIVVIFFIYRKLEKKLRRF